jgi:ABC-type polysaccharide/polyol phosphate transport system ATPase subunit
VANNNTGLVAAVPDVNAALAFAEAQEFLDTSIKEYISDVHPTGLLSRRTLGPEILIVDELLAVGEAATPPRHLYYY